VRLASGSRWKRLDVARVDPTDLWPGPSHYLLSTHERTTLTAPNRKLRERREETQSTGKHSQPAAVDSPSTLKRYAHVEPSGPQNRTGRTNELLSIVLARKKRPTGSAGGIDVSNFKSNTEAINSEKKGRLAGTRPLSLFGRGFGSTLHQNPCFLRP
jgi:hypothetical protein